MDDHGSGMREGADPWFGPEHRMLRDQVRRFVEEEIKPRADAWEEQGFVPREVLRRMGELGFFGIRYPAEYGGSEMDTLGNRRARRGARPLDLRRRRHHGAGPHRHGLGARRSTAAREAQRARWMPGIIAGEVITAVAMTEPDAGSDVKGIRTTRAARRRRLRPQRHEDVHHQRRPRRSLLRRRQDRRASAPRAAASRCSSSRRARPGFSVGRALDKHGWRSSDTAELVFEDCRIPAENLLGEEGRGFYAIMRNFQNERLVDRRHGDRRGAGGDRADARLGDARARPSARRCGTSRRSARRLAMLAAQVEAGRQLVYATAWRSAQGADCIREVSMVKAYCGELVNEVMYACVQFHGGMGFMRETAIERMARDARVQAIGGGATEVMLEEVAKRM